MTLPKTKTLNDCTSNSYIGKYKPLLRNRLIKCWYFDTLLDLYLKQFFHNQLESSLFLHDSVVYNEWYIFKLIIIRDSFSLKNSFSKKANYELYALKWILIYLSRLSLSERVDVGESMLVKFSTY